MTATDKKAEPAPKSPLPSIAAPKGGGAVRDIGEKFAVNAANGTGGMTIPVPVTAGRSGFGPSLALTYESGAGNGHFGLGWTLGVPSIVRKTDKGLPRYVDAAESDVFVLAGAEDLVPLLDDAGNRVWTTRTVHQVAYTVQFYRPRVEGAFARIERWTDGGGLSHWRTISRENITTLFGIDDTSRVSDPADPTRIFAYRVARTFDDKGNVCVYDWIPENPTGIDVTTAHEANRADAVRKTERYLKYIRYGNVQPYFPDWGAAGDETALPADWHFEVVLDYGDHGPDAPTPTPDRNWPVRPDPYSRYRAGFEVRTYRRCARVLMFHNFPAEAGVGTDCLVRSTDLIYSDQQAPTDPRNPIYTFVAAVTQNGYRRLDAGGYLRASMPPVELEYTTAIVGDAVLTLDSASAPNVPQGLGGGQWIDLDGEGLAGLLSDVDGAWCYERNLSANNRVPQSDGSLAVRARFGPLETVPALPSRMRLDGGTRLLSLAADGRLDVVALAEPDAGYMERSADATWGPLRRFASLPVLDWNEPNLTFVDLTGDGLADVLLTEDDAFSFWTSLGAGGFGSATRVAPGWDENHGAHAVLHDDTQTVFLADMTGDGLSDVVRVRNGEICYWPNLGYGRFGAKVTLDDSPRFADEERFDGRRVRLADVDGSGTADVVYVGDDGVRVWFNQSGNAFAAPYVLAVFPSDDALSTVQVVDLLGSGTACLVWSSPWPALGAPLRYVDLMAGGKPHLLTRVRNNLGAETRISYAPSTQFYLADREAGTPWLTRLHFPVQVVERIETFDWIGRSRFVSRYAYHHGYFDGIEREFRGFGMVEEWDTEERRDDTAFADGASTNWDDASLVPPVHTRTWFHTGAFAEAGDVASGYAAEYWGASGLPPSVFDPALTVPDEVREAYRALKGHLLRVEVFADDGSPRAGVPYTVTESTYTVRRIQPFGLNLHAAFYVHERETLESHYERAASDPRVKHDVVLDVDPFGNVTRSVAIGYPRRPGYAPPEPALSPAFQSMLAYDQTRLHVGAAQHGYTNDLTDHLKLPDAYRTPLPCESIVADVTGVSPLGTVFTFAELDAIWHTVWDGMHDVAYEDVPVADVDGGGALPNVPTRRIVEHSRTQYRSDDLSALLDLTVLQPGARAGEEYHLALTPSLVSSVFGALVDNAMLQEGGYVQLAGVDGWWTPSGRVYYSDGDADPAAVELAAAKAHFFVSRRSVDPFGATTRAGYDAYDLLGVSATDAVGNVTASTNDYRVLKPSLVTDPNGNQIQTAFDALGFVAGVAAMGKSTENLGDNLTGFVADLDAPTIASFLADPLTNAGAVLAGATSRFVYDLFAYQRTRDDAQPSPVVVASIARETHVSDLAPGQAARLHCTFVYDDGNGHEIQTKAPAAPGPVVDGGADVTPRWTGSGWTILDNKGNPVRKYEPFFSATHAFEFARAVGVSTTLCYDPVGRVVAQLHPDQSWEKVVFDPWRHDAWDGNDTVLIADPRTDPDVGDFFVRLLGNAPNAFTSWHDLRIGGTFGADPAECAAQQDAALKAEAHAATPTVTHADSAGRDVLVVADAGVAGRHPVRTALDAEAKALAVIDALGRRSVEHVRRVAQGGGVAYVAGYDLHGTALYENGSDGGERRTLHDVLGSPIRVWDALGRVFRIRYDAARRPTHRYVTVGGQPEMLLERLVYGEGHADRNLCTRLYRRYDGVGLDETVRHDYAGNVTGRVRQVAVGYHAAVDWSPLGDLTDAAALDTAATPLLDPNGRFTTSIVYDALNRPIQTVTPRSATMHPNVVRVAYDEAGLAGALDAWFQRAAEPAGLLDPVSADAHVASAIAYNARRERVAITLGNGTVTAYDYEPATFRLRGLTTTRPASFAPNQRVVQQLAYTYDPVGNVTRIRDTADIQNVVFFANQRVEPSTDYTYDARYRLTAARGREHLGQTGGVLAAPQQVGSDDAPRIGLAQPGDGNAMATYLETYAYDAADNILAMVHTVASGAWTRRYAYAEPSRITAGETGNRLSATSLPGDPVNGPYTARYAYDAHGNTVQMPHLPALTWDEHDRLRSTCAQVVAAGTPETTWYAYDAAGERARKVTDRQAAAGATAVPKAERIYLGAVEVYREFAADGITVTLQREVLHLALEAHRIALMETRTAGTDLGAANLLRYQFANHLESASLELDDTAQIISYEEFFPFGSTAYQAVRSQTQTPKRYRFTGKERDTENGFAYHGARYYAPWLGRWTACDPKGLVDGPNLYAYARNAPVRLVDPQGTQSAPPVKLPTSSSVVLYGYDTAGNPMYVLGGGGGTAPPSAPPAPEKPLEVTVHGPPPKHRKKKTKPSAGAGIGAGSTRSTIDALKRVQYERAIKQKSAEAVEQVRKLRASDKPGDAVKAWNAAEEASEFRGKVRAATRKGMSPTGRTMSDAIDKTHPTKWYAEKYSSPPEVRPKIGKGRPPMPPDPQGAYVYEVAEDVAKAAGKSRGGFPGLLLKSGRYLGPLGMAVGIGLSAREVYNAPEGERGRVAAREVGAFAYGMLGAEVGGLGALAVAGLILGATPVGWAAFGIAAAGALVGGLIFGYMGGQTGQGIYDRIFR